MGKPFLSKFSSNAYSQHGEDGILHAIFEFIGIEHNRCMEFGAWDGLQMSNTAELWKEKAWKAILAESDPVKFQQLQLNTSGKDIELHNCRIVPEGENSVDVILMGRKLDLISIDVDGDDWIIWDAMETRPRVVVIEYNASIPIPVVLAQTSGEYFGASAEAMIEIGFNKLYTLVCMTDSNCIFIRNDLLHFLSEFELDPIKLFPTKFLTYTVSAFDGRIGLTRNESAWGKFKCPPEVQIQLAKGTLFSPWW